jgi:RNA polymerase-binding transcription factor DksA
METETGTEREADSVTGPVIDGGVGSDAVVVEATPVEPADVDAVEALLDQVDAALARLDDGSYGRCQSCGTIIADERLAEIPTARTCAACVVPVPVAG